jgi:tetratricopeptide (TPR) repeat protein
MASGSAASPLSTGGAGTIFEYRVAAVVLAALLRGDRIEGLDLPVTRVGLQRRIAGHQLDDVVAAAEGGDGAPLTVEIQVKRRVAPLSGNAAWQSVILQCLAALDSDPKGIRDRHHRLGIAADGPVQQLEELKELTSWARAQTSAPEFIEVISAEGTVAERIRDRWRHLRTTVEDALTETHGSKLPSEEVDDAAFRIAAALHVWLVQVEDGGRDYREVLNRLSDLLPPQQPDAARFLFLHLVDIAQTLGPRAGTIDAERLRAELTARQVQLSTAFRGDSPGPSALSAGLLITNLPPPNRVFTGREDLLLKIHERLTGVRIAVVAVHGLGGVGKSQLVLQYAHRHRDDYSIIWWIRAESQLTAATDLAVLASRMGLLVEDDLDVVVHAVKAGLSARRDWLLVFDNAVDQASVAPFLPAGEGHVLITSRARDWRQIAVSLHAEVMSAQEAGDFLRRRTDRDEAAADELSVELGNLPLALAQAATYIAAYGISIEGYLSLYSKASARMLAAGPAPAGYPHTVATTWLLHFDALLQSHPAAVDVLNLCAFLAPDLIPLGLLLDTPPPDIFPGKLAAVADDPVERDTAIGALVSTSLLDRLDDSTVRIHRLVQEVTRAQLTADERRAWATASVRLVSAAYPDDPDRPENWGRAATLTAHGLIAARRAEEDPGEDTGDLIDLLNAMGIYLSGRAELTSARELFQRALQLAEAAQGADHSKVADLLDNLGLVLRRLGELHRARDHHLRALRIKTAALDPIHPAVALSLNNLAGVLGDLGEHPAACDLLQQAVTIQEAIYGPNDPEVAHTLRELGMSLTNLGEPASAIAPLRRALAIQRAIYSDGDPEVGRTLGALGVALKELGDYPAARDHLQTALTIAESSYGPEHPEVARHLANLGNVLDDLGDYNAARVHLERALEIIETVYGPDHLDAASVLMTLSVVLDNLGDERMVYAYRQRAFRICLEKLGPDHPNTKIVARSLNAHDEP